jgi:hypothetical protein
LCRCNVQRCSACGNHSGLIVKTIPGYCENPFAFPPESLFTFTPESCSPSPRNAFHVHPGIPFTFLRNPHLQLNRLLWVNCKGNPEHALKATDLLLHGGGFGLMVFDAGDTSDSLLRRMPMASWYRLRLGAEKTGTALIALTPAPQTRSCSAACVELNRSKSIWRGRLLRGIASTLEARKHNGTKRASFESVL